MVKGDNDSNISLVPFYETEIGITIVELTLNRDIREYYLRHYMCVSKYVIFVNTTHSNTIFSFNCTPTFPCLRVV